MAKMNRIGALGWLAGSCLSACTAGQALAQERDDDGAVPKVIEEVMVTSQRRKQPVRDVGAAVSAIAGDSMVQWRLTDPSDLSRHVPSLQIKTIFNHSNPQIFMRGVGVNDDTALTSGAVGIYSDDVYIGAPAGQLFPLFDLERIEVLRGPQGTLYGRNTTGGAINFISRRPGDRFEATARISYGTFDALNVEGALGGPLSSSLNARLAFVSNRRDGYVDNHFLGTRDTDVDNWAARGLIELELGDRTSVLLRIHGARNDALARQFKSQGLLDPDSVAAGMPRPCATPRIIGTCSNVFGYIDGVDPHSGSWDRRLKELIDIDGASATLQSVLGSLELTSITALAETVRWLQADTDGSPNQILHIDWGDSNRQISQEFRLQSTSQQQVNWLAGLYYLNQDITIDQRNDAFRELRPVFGFDPGRFIINVETHLEQELDSYAAFGQLDFDLTDKLGLVAGLRYTNERRDMQRTDALVEPGFSVPLVGLAESVSFDNLSGRLGLEYRESNGNLAYGSISSGFKSGGFNGAVALDPGSVPPFDEETLVTLEAGYKWQAASHRWAVNTAAFHSAYDDLQVFTRITDQGIPRELLTNAGNASVTGLEVEIRAIPSPGTHLNLALSLLDTELTDYQTDAGQEFSGNKLVGAPDVTLNGWVRRETDLFHGRLALQGGFHYQDRVFFETSNNPLLAQDAYWLFDARLAFSPHSQAWELALWGQNLSDEAYLTGAVGLGLFSYNLQSWGAPRTWGIEFIWFSKR